MERRRWWTAIRYAACCYCKRRRQLAGQLCAPLPPLKYLIPTLLFLISSRRLFHCVSSHPNSTTSSLSGSLSRVRRLLCLRLASYISEGKARGCSFLRKPRRQPVYTNQSREPSATSNSNSTTNYCLLILAVFLLFHWLSSRRNESCFIERFQRSTRWFHVNFLSN